MYSVTTFGLGGGGPEEALLSTLLRHTICAIHILPNHHAVDFLDTRDTLKEDLQVSFSLTHLSHVPKTPAILKSRCRHM